jgi:hypothetical protein
MRSFENIVRDGRFRVPATGTPIRIGEPVILDSANPGQLKQATNGVAPGQGAGIAVFEHITFKSDQIVTVYDDPYDKVPLGQYAQMVHGPGAKVWLKNTPQKTLYDGRVRDAVTMVTTDLSTVTIGQGLVPAGGGQWRVTDGTTSGTTGGTAWLIVEQVNATTGLVEARFNF